MSYVEPRKTRDGSKQYRLREYWKEPLSGGPKKLMTVIRNLGAWKARADDVQEDFEKAKSRGFTYTPPIEIKTVYDFIKAMDEGRDAPAQGRPLRIEEMCDLWLKFFGPSLKGGISDVYNSPYRHLKYRLEQLKRRWSGKFAHDISELDVRDYLTEFKTIGTRMRNLGALGHMFKGIAKWNKKGILPGRYLMPQENPFKEWRAAMKPADKREVPASRVLTPAEWARFAEHLTPRARAICELALRRFLRKSDIKNITHHAIVDGHIKGLQEKTGESFHVPVLAGQPANYNFTNFRREFEAAQKKTGFYHPPGHPLHFTLKDLRRTGATWGYRKSKNLKAVSDMLGHRSILTTQRYLNINQADKTAVARAVDKLFAARAGSAGGVKGKKSGQGIL